MLCVPIFSLLVVASKHVRVVCGVGVSGNRRNAVFRVLFRDALVSGAVAGGIVV